MKKILYIFWFFVSTLHADSFVLFTEPKTGTHLLVPILQQLTGKKVFWPKKFQENAPLCLDQSLDINNPDHVYFSVNRYPWTRETMDAVWQINEAKNTFLHLHPPYSPFMENYLREKNCVNFFVKRDPRDQLLSLLNHFRYIQPNDKRLESIDSDDERLFVMIRKDMRRYTLGYMGWLNSPVCCVLDFSKLMGAHGGAATDDDALAEMRKIASCLKLKLSDASLQAVYKKSFGRGWSFFKGKVAAWKDTFTERHKDAVKEEIGDLLIELGYEKDLSW